jgi:hypothetical protein
VFYPKVGSDEKGILVEEETFYVFQKEISNLPWKT